MRRNGKLWEKTWVFFGYQYFTQFGKVRPDHFNGYNQMSPSRGTKVREKMRKIEKMGENYEEMFLSCLIKDMRVSLRPWTGHRGNFFHQSKLRLYYNMCLRHGIMLSYIRTVWLISVEFHIHVLEVVIINWRLTN